MNNPFSRLKHYLPSDIDPQENHATECLAACVVFSSTIRRAFIKFLLGGQIEMCDSAEVEVVTQQPIEGGYIDLLARQNGKFVLAVEVKVKSPENCNHHRKQLQDYRKWLEKQSEPDRYLFTLVRNEDNSFRPTQYGANARQTWWALYKCFQSLLRADDISDVESSLIKHFCDYLESEAIVSTYEIEDLLSYGAGVKARKAVKGVFNQIASRLEGDEFQTISIEDRRDYWPQLRFQHPRWKKIFGKGDNWKISLWFCVPGIWEASEHTFSPEIEIWNEDHGNDWRFAKSRLSSWLGTLKAQNFDWAVFKTWNKAFNNIPVSEIQTEPKKIIAWRDTENIILNQDKLQNEDDLVNLLVERVKEYSKVLESLG